MKSRARRGSPLPPGARWPFRLYAARRTPRRKLHWDRWGVADLPRTSDKKRAIEDQE